MPEEERRYGSHVYPAEFGQQDEKCLNGCGCWVSRSDSGGPPLLDPFPGGECPNNPLSGVRQRDDRDYWAVVKRRFNQALAKAAAEKKRADELRDLYDQADPGAVALAEQLAKLQARFKLAREKVNELCGLVEE